MPNWIKNTLKVHIFLGICPLGLGGMALALIRWPILYKEWRGKRKEMWGWG